MDTSKLPAEAFKPARPQVIPLRRTDAALLVEIARNQRRMTQFMKDAAEALTQMAAVLQPLADALAAPFEARADEAADPSVTEKE